MGCMTALHLARGGMRVSLLERRGLCMEASGVNAGTLTMQTKQVALMPYAWRGYQLWRSAPEWLGMDVEIRPKGGLILAFTEEEARLLQFLMKRRKAAGSPIEIIDRKRAQEIEPGLSDHPILASYCELDGYGNPSLIGLAFRNALLKENVDVRERSAVASIEREKGGFTIRTGEGAVRTRRIVLTAGVWLRKMLQWFNLDFPILCRINMVSVTERMRPVMRTVIGITSGLLTLKQTETGTVLIGGGWQGIGDPERGGVEIIPENLVGNIRLAHYSIPALAEARVVRTWLGLDSHTPDFMPLVGPLPGVENAFMIGCVRSGYTTGPYVAQLLADSILGREPEMPLFDPARAIDGYPDYQTGSQASEEHADEGKIQVPHSALWGAD